MGKPTIKAFVATVMAWFFFFQIFTAPEVVPGPKVIWCPVGEWRPVQIYLLMSFFGVLSLLMCLISFGLLMGIAAPSEKRDSRLPDKKMNAYPMGSIRELSREIIKLPLTVITDAGRAFRSPAIGRTMIMLGNYALLVVFMIVSVIYIGESGYQRLRSSLSVMIVWTVAVSMFAIMLNREKGEKKI